MRPRSLGELSQAELVGRAKHWYNSPGGTAHAFLPGLQV